MIWAAATGWRRSRKCYRQPSQRSPRVSVCNLSMLRCAISASIAISPTHINIDVRLKSLCERCKGNPLFLVGKLYLSFKGALWIRLIARNSYLDESYFATNNRSRYRTIGSPTGGRVAEPDYPASPDHYKGVFMKPFVIAQHEKDRANIRELRETELAHVGGGNDSPNLIESKLNTTTVSPGGSKDDGADEG